MSDTVPIKRRTVLVGAAAAAAAAAPAHAAELAPVRRIVTGEGSDGRSTILFDGPPPQSFEMNGTTIMRLWETDTVPARLPIGEDKGAGGGNDYREGFAGTSFYIADIPGKDAGVAIPMHKEDSVDYMAVLAGEVTLVLDDQETVMRTGDVLVQSGNNHTWENRTDETCRLLVVVQRANRRTAG